MKSWNRSFILHPIFVGIGKSSLVAHRLVVDCVSFMLGFITSWPPPHINIHAARVLASTVTYFILLPKTDKQGARHTKLFVACCWGTVDAESKLEKRARISYLPSIQQPHWGHCFIYTKVRYSHDCRKKRKNIEQEYCVVHWQSIPISCELWISLSLCMFEINFVLY